MQEGDMVRNTGEMIISSDAPKCAKESFLHCHFVHNNANTELHLVDGCTVARISHKCRTKACIINIHIPIVTSTHSVNG
jgi:hypothetical protein